MGCLLEGIGKPEERGFSESPAEKVYANGEPTRSKASRHRDFGKSGLGGKAGVVANLIASDQGCNSSGDWVGDSIQAVIVHYSRDRRGQSRSSRQSVLVIVAIEVVLWLGIGGD